MPLAASGQQQPVPSAAGLRAATAAALANPALAGNLGLTVRDAATGTHLLDVRSNDPLLPASSLKLLSAAAVDATFPAGATLTTKVVQGGRRTGSSSSPVATPFSTPGRATPRRWLVAPDSATS